MALQWNLDAPGTPDMTIQTDDGGTIHHDAATGVTTYTTPDGHTTIASGSYTSKSGNTYTWGNGNTHDPLTSQTEYTTREAGDNSAEEDRVLDEAAKETPTGSTGGKPIGPITKKQFGSTSGTQTEHTTKESGDNTSEDDPYLEQQANKQTPGPKNYSDSPYDYMRERRWESKGTVPSGSGYDPITRTHTNTGNYTMNAAGPGAATMGTVATGAATAGAATAVGYNAVFNTVENQFACATATKKPSGVSNGISESGQGNGYTQVTQADTNSRSIWSVGSSEQKGTEDNIQTDKKSEPAMPIGPGAEPWKFQDKEDSTQTVKKSEPVQPIGPGAEPWKFQDVTGGGTTGNGVIAWDVELMSQHVAKLLRAAEDLQCASDTLNAIKERISTAWDGNAAAVFLSEMCIDIADYKKVVENIKVLADALTRVIGVYNECEGTVASGMSTLDTQLTALQGNYTV